MFFTDGLFKKRIYQGRKLSRKKISEIIQQLGDKSIEEIKDHLLSNFKKSQEASEIEDDLTMVMLEISNHHQNQSSKPDNNIKTKIATNQGEQSMKDIDKKDDFLERIKKDKIAPAGFLSSKNTTAITPTSDKKISLKFNRKKS